MKTKRVLALLALSVGLFAAPPKQPMTDDMLADKVKMKLAQDQIVKGGGLDIAVKDGVVTLSGKVQSDQQKSKAEKLTKKVAGVKSVDNKIVVTHAP
jgi:osmotically-inducible protein OsmY